MAKDYEGSLGGEKTFQGQPKPKADDLETRSLGDQATFAGGRAVPRDQSLGDQMTFGAGKGDADDAVDDGMEVVDLSARYKIEQTLGKGGMGEVLLATDTRLERKVAIKRILGEAARSRTAVNRFLTEAKSIAALNHPNIVQIYDYGRATDGPFLIMEFVDGESLLDRTRAGALPLEEAVELTCQLCDGLAKAHDAGIIHRDIKPANVLLSKDGIPKLTDFGLAKAETADTGMTMAGAVLGTLDFMPPEQRRDAALTDARSDLWSLAATLYQLVTGKSPKIIKFNDIPKALQEFLGKALEDNRDDRYQSARDFKQALKQALAAGTEVQLETGDCPHCGTRNETSRKFCKKCAQSLEVSCLSCESKIPMWEEVCGNCGTQQSKLLEQRKQAMAAERARAEQLLDEFEFTKAASLARRLGEEHDLRLQQLRGWSDKFQQAVESAEQDQLARVGELTSAALKHEQAADYPAAMQALEQIPKPLLSSILSGDSDSAGEILERVQGKQAECKRLEKVIKQRIESRQLNGLLVEVEKLLQLRPDKSDALKLKKQLQERETKLRQTRDEAFAAAQNLAAEHDYEAAWSELARIDDYVIDETQQRLRDELQAKLDELQQLQERINSRLASKKYAGVLGLVEQFLELRPKEQSMLALREKLKARDAKNEAAVQSVVDNANALRSRGDFAGAIGLLSKIPPELESNAGYELLAECSELAEMRQQAIDGLQRGLANSQFRAGLTGAGVYSDRIDDAGITDTEFNQLFQQYETGLAEQERNEAQRKKFNQQVKIGSVAAAVLLLLGVVSYFVMSASMRTAAIKRALAVGDYEEVLRVDASKLPSVAYSKLSQEVVLKLPPVRNSIGVEIKLLPIGQFTMGEGRNSYEVKLTKPYYLGVYEITQKQYEIVMGKRPSRYRGDNYPVDSVSWDEAKIFCQKLSELPEEKAAGRMYRLPTCAEWEFACRAGGQTAYCFGDNESELSEYAWYKKNSNKTTHPVGQKKSNRWGFFDMHGNAYEWCADWHGDHPKLSVTDPLGPKTGIYRMIRGGCWKDEEFGCRSAFEAWSRPDIRNGGFRVAVSLPDISNMAYMADPQKQQPQRLGPNTSDFEAAKSEIPASRMSESEAVLKPLNGVSNSPPSPGSSVSSPTDAMERSEKLTNSMGITLALIPKGTFIMGAAAHELGRCDDERAHNVTLSKDFYLGVTEVTQDQYKNLMGKNPSYFQGDKRNEESGNCPVENVSWEDALEFCRRLSELPEEKKSGRVYRLPTEAEWEYSCRAGSTTTFYFGDDASQLGQFAWCDLNSIEITRPVGLKRPNAWGLYDMYGNVWEWCADWYGEYPVDAVIDPAGPGQGDARVYRGGCWGDKAPNCRSANRHWYSPTLRSQHNGFRVALDFTIPKK
jgi:formylglycine-generating enzyme required for sulfatase activity/serine/threonine protein kinase